MRYQARIRKQARRQGMRKQASVYEMHYLQTASHHGGDRQPAEPALQQGISDSRTLALHVSCESDIVVEIHCMFMKPFQIIDCPQIVGKG